jgi:hypothetical protein
MDCWYIPYYHLFHSQTQLSPPNLVVLCKKRKNHALLFFFSSTSNRRLSHSLLIYYFSFQFIFHLFTNGYVLILK